MVACFFVIWLILDRSAAWLGSFRGEAGVLVCLLTVAAALTAEVVVFGTRPRDAVAALGLQPSNRRGLVAVAALALCLLLLFPAFAVATGTPMRLVDDWPWLAPGIFMQAGIAEETLFRGFLFRHFREGRTFWRAAILAAIPFVAVHLLILFTTELALAVAAIAVSVSLTFPFAWLFERSGNSIWPVAILHAVVQGAIKLVVVPEASFLTLALMWMGLSSLLPWLVFAMRPSADSAKSG